MNKLKHTEDLNVITEEKNQIPPSLKEWENRAKRRGLQKVMSTRLSKRQCIEVTIKMEKIFNQVLSKYISFD